MEPLGICSRREEEYNELPFEAFLVAFLYPRRYLATVGRIAEISHSPVGTKTIVLRVGGTRIEAELKLLVEFGIESCGGCPIRSQ